MKPRLHFIDWMKFLGISLIVYGHVAAAFLNKLAPPIYPKQFGVAFFLFAAGYSLARETRPGLEVLYRRLFEIFLIGVPFAMLMSAIGFVQGKGLALSNYLPFLFGANVRFNNFPANPTTWYIGTYIHILILWAVLLRRVSVRPWMLIATVIAEVLIRAALIKAAGLYIAYMAFSNWATVFLLGMYQGQREESETEIPIGRVAVLGLIGLAWPLIALSGVLGAERSFPFMRFRLEPEFVALVVSSIGVSSVYLLYTILARETTRRLRDFKAVRFIARNTVFIFIAHMPLFYAIETPLNRAIGNAWWAVGIRFAICYLGPALVSELIHKIIQVDRMRDRIQMGLSTPKRRSASAA